MEKATGRYWVYDAEELRYLNFDESTFPGLIDLVKEYAVYFGFFHMCFGDAAYNKLEELDVIPDGIVESS